MMREVIASSANRVVVGLGATGLSCARFLHRRGEQFSVVDTREHPPGLAELQAEMPRVPVFLGQPPEGLLESGAELVVSPALRWTTRCSPAPGMRAHR